jgi:radical SAM protein with 4Fe4S-binding SPASM domain
LTVLGRGLGVHVTLDLRRSALPPRGSLRCFQPWEQLCIGVKGDVHPCCAVYDADRRPLMGNLLEQDFASIWHGDGFREFRRTCAAGTNPLCRACPYY